MVGDDERDRGTGTNHHRGVSALEERPIDAEDPEDRRIYLEGLEAGFGHWGGDDRFDWAFLRRCGGPAADLILLRDGTAVLAGSAVTYRMVAGDDGVTKLVGIMTGSWTLPESRGRGCFTHIVEWSRRTALARGAALLLAFVTDDNASRRRLEAAGAVTSETSYLFTTEQTTVPGEGVASVTASATDVERVAEQALVERRPGHRFTYPDAAAWLGQFVHRPDPVEVVTVAGATVVLERAEKADRVLAVVGGDDDGATLDGLVRTAIAARKQLFCFSTDPAWSAAAKARGLTSAPGRLTMLPPGAALPGRWSIAGGDRM